MKILTPATKRQGSSEMNKRCTSGTYSKWILKHIKVEINTTRLKNNEVNSCVYIAQPTLGS